MINSLDRVLQGACTSLREVIIPGLEGDHLRSQAFGIIQALEGLRLVVDWAMPPLLEQIAIQDAVIAECLAMLEGTGAPAWAPVPTPASGAEALRARDHGEAFIGDLLRFLPERELPSATADRARAILRKAMGDQLAVEMRHVPKPMFSEISSGQAVDR